MSSRVTQGLILGLKVFNIFVKDLDDAIESILAKLADDTKKREEVNTSQGRAILQRHLKRLEQMVSKDNMKFNKDERKPCTWDRITKEPSTGYVSWLWSSLAVRDLEVLVDNKLHRSQQ